MTDMTSDSWPRAFWEQVAEQSPAWRPFVANMYDEEIGPMERERRGKSRQHPGPCCLCCEDSYRGLPQCCHRAPDNVVSRKV